MSSTLTTMGKNSIIDRDDDGNFYTFYLKCKYVLIKIFNMCKKHITKCLSSSMSLRLFSVGQSSLAVSYKSFQKYSSLVQTYPCMCKCPHSYISNFLSVSFFPTHIELIQHFSIFCCFHQAIYFGDLCISKYV